MSKNYLKLIKKLDLFAQPLFTFNTNRNKATHKKNFAIEHGSIVGGLLTLLCGLCSISYILYEILSMNNGEYDNINQILITNPLSNDNYSIVSINNTSFIPILTLV